MANTTPSTPVGTWQRVAASVITASTCSKANRTLITIFSISSTLGFVYSPPLPCWTPMSIRSLSISVTFRQIACETRQFGRHNGEAPFDGLRTSLSRSCEQCVSSCSGESGVAALPLMPIKWGFVSGGYRFLLL
jgi:hypothetical protein